MVGFLSASGISAVFHAQWLNAIIEYKSGISGELYAKVASHPLTALKTSSKCSFIPYKLRFLVSFRLVMKHDPTFAYGSGDSTFPIPIVARVGWGELANPNTTKTRADRCFR
uniref:Uncharacterized protein n=1 Tax=Candidatus Kentrum sp. DK TaxID=2126562 RepID=A0A450SAV8_9GAMM|nr:MAG: hypothetical protein BECKDK2373B_GA0170837_102310 [Candidatus Kentron sp. DK]